MRFPRNSRRLSAHVVRRALENFRVFDAIPPPGTKEQPISGRELGVAKQQFAAQRVPCPFLEDGRCLIYKSRPLMYRTRFEATSAERGAPRTLMRRVRNVATASSQWLFDCIGHKRAAMYLRDPCSTSRRTTLD